MSDDLGRKSTVAAPYPATPSDASVRDVAPQSPPTRLADAWAFLRGFLAKPSEVASVVPTSLALEKRLVLAAELARARCVVELGPGTGGTTRALLRALPPQGRLLAIEVNADFCDRLRRTIDDPRFVLRAGSAESLAETLRRSGLPAADVVVTGIPFSTLPPEAARNIAAAIHDNLAPGGRVVAYQLRAHVADYLQPHLGPPRRMWEWRSLPPLRVMVWTKPAAGSDGRAATASAHPTQASSQSAF